MLEGVRQRHRDRAEHSQVQEAAVDVDALLRPSASAGRVCLVPSAVADAHLALVFSCEPRILRRRDACLSEALGVTGDSTERDVSDDTVRESNALRPEERQLRRTPWPEHVVPWFRVFLAESRVVDVLIDDLLWSSRSAL